MDAGFTRHSAYISFTLKVEVYEDDQKRMVDKNSGLGELLRLLLLQNHVHHGDRNLKE